TQFGSVTQDQAARYMPLAYERAQQNWPWVGVINYWFFKRPSDEDKNQSYYYFRMVEPDFTPLPIYDRMKQYIANATPTLYAGVHQEDDWAIKADANAKRISLNAAELGGALQASDVTFSYRGTGMVVRWIGLLSNKITISVDGGEAILSRAPAISTLAISVTPALWTDETVGDSFSAQTHTVHITAESPFLLDSITVYDRSSQNVLPLILVGVALGGLAVVEIGVSLWKRFA
ncbi:MAG: hypothetical protein ABI700_17035, partial [Chloroflexota bacterium]